jgi:hypothetical protein
MTVPGWASDLRISPDGNTVAYVEHPERWDSFGHIAIVDRAGKKTILTGDYSSALGLAWDPSGKEIWYTAIQDPYFQQPLRGFFVRKATIGMGRSREHDS